MAGAPDGPFSYVDGRLGVEGVDVADIVALAGTPAYVYSLGAVTAAWHRMASAFAPLGARVLYSVKANGNLAVLRHVAGLGAGFNIASGGELTRVLAAGGSDVVVFAGLGKTADELALAVDHDVLLHVESADELAAVDAVAAGRGRRARVALRVNPGVDAATHPGLRTGHDEAKFGMRPDVARRLFQRMAGGELPAVEPVGVHVHVGSNLPGPEVMVTGATVALDVLDHGRGLGLALDWLDVGGGFPAAGPGPGAFADALAPVVEGSGVQLAVEPGRSLVAAAGALLAQVLYRNHRGRRRVFVLDTGMHHLVRPALYGARHPVVPVHAAAAPGPATVVGPCCESSDVLADQVDLPDLVPGDLVAILDAGAYGMAMASNYNGHPRPAEVVVDAGVATLVRARETWADLLVHETGT